MNEQKKYEGRRIKKIDSDKVMISYMEDNHDILTIWGEVVTIKNGFVEFISDVNHIVIPSSRILKMKRNKSYGNIINNKHEEIKNEN